jgi:hypothetical protein
MKAFNSCSLLYRCCRQQVLLSAACFAAVHQKIKKRKTTRQNEIIAPKILGMFLLVFFIFYLTKMTYGGMQKGNINYCITIQYVKLCTVLVVVKASDLL